MTDKERLELETMAKIFEEKLELKLEMSYTLDRIYTKIDDACEPTIKHLMLCFLFRDSVSLNHWKKEVGSILGRTYLIKNTNKYPSEKWFNKKCFDWLDTFYNTLDTRVDTLVRVEELSKPIFSKDNLYNFVVTYFKWLYKKFAEKGEVTLDEVSDCIDELLKQYKLN